MYVFPDLSLELQEMCESGLVFSPWLAGIGTVRFDPAVFEMIDLETRNFALRQWTATERLKVFGNLPSNDRMVTTGVYEIVASTSVYLAHERTGSLEVDESLVREVLGIVERFTDKHGFSTLLLLYMLMTSWENQMTLAYYGEIPESEFLLGNWHRPWMDYSIWDEVLFACHIGTMRIIIRDGQRYVQLTDDGYQALAKTAKVLEKAGYFKQRLQTLRISQLSLFDDYPKLAAEIWPNFMDQRHAFLDWAGIMPGMNVLELGCADGTFTFDGGLAARVGPNGRVIAVDPSSGMIARAKARQKTLGMEWVEFRQGRAENLPFSNEEFDAVIGVAFLHFTERPLALEEMRRVVRPGGVVASFHPTKFTADVAFFREWFAPLFELAARREESPKDYLPYPEEVINAFQGAGLQGISSEYVDVTTLYHDPDKVVRHFIEGVGWFAEELCALPWKARLDVIEALKARGREVCQKYPKTERIIQFPNQIVKGFVPQK